MDWRLPFVLLLFGVYISCSLAAGSLVSLSGCDTASGTPTTSKTQEQQRILLPDSIKTESLGDIIANHRRIEPVRLWLILEQVANVPQWQQTTRIVDVPISTSPKDGYEIVFSPATPDQIRFRLKKRSKDVPWLTHPFNTDPRVAHRGEASTFARAYGTASRSMYFLDGPYSGHTVRMATNRPHENGDYQDKVDVQHREAMRRSQQIAETQATLLDADSDLSIQLEVASIVDKHTGIGQVVRDRSVFDSVFNHSKKLVPATSLGFVGKAIANLNDTEPISFWKTHYARALGRAKAKLALIYQIQYSTPNRQNILIEFDQDFRPTGRIVFRDVSDTYLIQRLAELAGRILDPSLDLERQTSYELNPKWSVSSFYFDDMQWPIGKQMQKEMQAVHDEAYVDLFNHALGTNFDAKDPMSIHNVFRFLGTIEGQISYTGFLAKIKKPLH